MERRIDNKCIVSKNLIIAAIGVCYFILFLVSWAYSSDHTAAKITPGPAVTDYPLIGYWWIVTPTMLVTADFIYGACTSKMYKMPYHESNFLNVLQAVIHPWSSLIWVFRYKGRLLRTSTSPFNRTNAAIAHSHGWGELYNSMHETFVALSKKAMRDPNGEYMIARTKIMSELQYHLEDSSSDKRDDVLDKANALLTASRDHRQRRQEALQKFEAQEKGELVV